MLPFCSLIKSHLRLFSPSQEKKKTRHTTKTTAPHRPVTWSLHQVFRVIVRAPDRERTRSSGHRMRANARKPSHRQTVTQRVAQLSALPNLHSALTTVRPSAENDGKEIHQHWAAGLVCRMTLNSKLSRATTMLDQTFRPQEGANHHAFRQHTNRPTREKSTLNTCDSPHYSNMRSLGTIRINM